MGLSGPLIFTLLIDSQGPFGPGFDIRELQELLVLDASHERLAFFGPQGKFH